MELLLNLVWALITTVLVAFCARAGCRTTRTWRLVAGTLTVLCVALLLFPVISMTDDLNPSPVYAEDANAVKRMSRSAAPAHQQITPHALPAIASASLRIPLPRLLGAVVLDRPHISVPGSQPSRLAGRSPPARSA